MSSNCSFEDMLHKSGADDAIRNRMVEIKAVGKRYKIRVNQSVINNMATIERENAEHHARLAQHQEIIDEDAEETDEEDIVSL